MSLIFRIASLCWATVSLLAKGAKGGGEKGLRRDAPPVGGGCRLRAGYGGQRSEIMADSVPLRPPKCPPSDRNTVRHAAGMVSAIGPESCPSWAGTRTIGCAVATGIGAVLHTARVERGTSVAVFGLGGIGLNVVQGARLAGAAKIIGIDVNPAREAIARHFGATDFVDPRRSGDVVGQIRALTGGGADYSFECVGATLLMAQALECVRPGWGVCTVLGVPPDGEKLAVAPFDLQLGRTLKGSFLGNVKTRSQLPTLLDLHVEGRINLHDLVTQRLPIERINEGFELMREGRSIRTVVTFDERPESLL